VSVLADLTVIVHLAFVVFVMLGGLLVLRWPRVAWLHLPAVVWAAWIEFAGWFCPLTPLENWLRQQGGDAGYQSSFVEHYFIPALYPPSLSRGVQWVLGGLVLLVNSLVYVRVFRRRRHKP
jgi:hypothetical protein